jgi:hypothetical protein
MIQSPNESSFKLNDEIEIILILSTDLIDWIKECLQNQYRLGSDKQTLNFDEIRIIA